MQSIIIRLFWDSLIWPSVSFPVKWGFSTYLFNQVGDTICHNADNPKTLASRVTAGEDYFTLEHYPLRLPGIQLTSFFLVVFLL